MPETPSIAEIVKGLHSGSGSGSGISSEAREEFRALLALGFQHGNFSPDEAKALARESSPEDLALDVWDAKERAFGIGSTNPREVAEVYGWGSWKHQQAELSAKDRSKIVAESNFIPPLDDHEYLRDLLRRYNIGGVTISAQSDIRFATPEEWENKPATALAYSGGIPNYPIIHVNRAGIEGKTKREIEDILAHEFIHTLMASNVGHGPEFMAYADERNIPSRGHSERTTQHV